jgi:hypothetical protein
VGRRIGLAAVVVLVLVATASAACRTQSPSKGGDTSSVQLGQRTKTSGCKANGALPDSACTPGATIPSATKEQICQPGYARDVRDVPDSEKNQVYAEYGIGSHQPGQYEVDHLISLELGGSNDIANLWPQPAEPRPGFHEKDRVENYLHDQVCSGAMGLPDAQHQIATNWLAVYQRMPTK